MTGHDLDRDTVFLLDQFIRGKKMVLYTQKVVAFLSCISHDISSCFASLGGTLRYSLCCNRRGLTGLAGHRSLYWDHLLDKLRSSISINIPINTGNIFF